MPRPLLWLLIAAPTVLLIAFFTLSLTHPGEVVERPSGVRTIGDAHVGGAFALLDHADAADRRKATSGQARVKQLA